MGRPKRPFSRTSPGGALKSLGRIAAVSVVLILGIPTLCLGRSAALSEHVIIVIIDGLRLAESFDSPVNVPRMSSELIPQGAYFSEFYNEGFTFTCPGHASILTGRWQFVANDGSEQPHDPTIFEWYRKETGAPRQSCWVVAGKSKLHMLTSSDDPAFGTAYGAVDSSGQGGDLATMETLFDVLENQRPSVVIVNLPDTDVRGHAEDYPGYVAAIATADSLVGALWDYLQAHPDYSSRSTLLVTTDHGRHDDRPSEPYDGFKNHGDGCHGCQHIPLLAVGAGIVATGEVTLRHDMRDLGATLVELLGLETPVMAGFPMYEVLIPPVTSPPLVPGMPRIVAIRPSPFVPGGSIELSIPPGAAGRLEIYDMRGRHVRSLRTTPGASSGQLLIWDGQDESSAAVASGSYLLRLQSGGGTAFGRLILLR